MGDNTLSSVDCKTVLHSGIKKTVNADVSLAPSLLLSEVLFHTVFLPDSRNGTLFLCVLQSFSLFFVSFHLTLLLSTRHGCNISAFPFLSHYLFTLPPNSYLYLFSSFVAEIALPLARSTFIFSPFPSH